MNKSPLRTTDVTDRIIESLQARVQGASDAGEKFGISFHGPGDHQIHDTGLGVTGGESATSVRYIPSFEALDGQRITVADRHLTPDQINFYTQQYDTAQATVSHLQSASRSAPSLDDEPEPPAPGNSPSM